MNIPIEKNQRGNKPRSMRYSENTNIAPTAPKGGESGSGVSFRLRRRSTALGLLNRGLASWYPGSSDDVVWKDEDEQLEFDQKMEVLLKNTHVFEKFKDRVAASEAFSNPMAARMVLEEFLQKDLLLVGKQGLIHRHSALIKHLVLTQRAPGGDTSSASSVSSSSSSSSSSKFLLRKPSMEKNSRHSTAETTKSDSFTAAESSESTFFDDCSNSPTWSPFSDKKTVTFSGMPVLSSTLHVPMLKDEMGGQVFDSFVN